MSHSDQRKVAGAAAVLLAILIGLSEAGALQLVGFVVLDWSAKLAIAYTLYRLFLRRYFVTTGGTGRSLRGRSGRHP